MATVSSLVTVFIDPDSNEPLALSALGEGDVISERIGGTGRSDISGLVSSVGNVNITYNETTRQFVVDEVSGVSAEVTFDSVRNALASGNSDITFSGGDFIISGGGKFRGDLSGNLSGVASRAELVSGVVINSQSYNLSAGTNINISTTATVDFSSVSSALASATGPVSFNGQNVSSVGEFRASGTVSGAQVVATGTITGATVRATTQFSGAAATIAGTITATDVRGTTSVSSESFSATSGRISNLSALTAFSAPTATIANTMTAADVRGTTSVSSASFSATNARISNISALTAFSSPAATIAGTMTAADIRGTTSVSSESFSATSGRISNLSALTAFSAPLVNTTQISTNQLTAAGNVQLNSGLTVTGGTGLFTTGIIVTGTIKGDSLSATNASADIIRVSNYVSGNLSGVAVSSNYASAVDGVTINGTTVDLRSGGSITIAATGNVSFSGVKEALEAATSAVGFNNQDVSNISNIRATNLRFSGTASGAIGIFDSSLRTDYLRSVGSDLIISSVTNKNIDLRADSGGLIVLGSGTGGGVIISRGGIETTNQGPLRVKEELSASTLRVSGTSQFDNTVTVTGGGLQVTGGSTFGTIIGSTIRATTQFSGPSATIDAATINGNLQVTGAITVTGTSTFNTSVSTPEIQTGTIYSNNTGVILSSLSPYNTAIYGENISLITDATGETQVNTGKLIAPIVRATNYFSGNVSGLALSATNAQSVPGCTVNGSPITANTTINIAAGSVDFTSVSSAIYSATGPLSFNGKDLNNVEDISASGDIRASSVSATNVSGLNARFNTSVSTPSFTATTANTGALNTTGAATFSDNVTITGTNKGFFATGLGGTMRSLSMSAQTVIGDFGVTSNGNAQINGTTTTNDLVSTDTIKGITVSATGSFSGPSATLTTATLGTANITNANVTGTLTVTGLTTTGDISCRDIAAEDIIASGQFSGVSAVFVSALTVTGTTTGKIQLGGAGPTNYVNILGSLSAAERVDVGTRIRTPQLLLYDDNGDNIVGINCSNKKLQISELGFGGVEIFSSVNITQDLYVTGDGDGSGYINYVSAQSLRVGDVTVIAAGLGANVEGQLTFGDTANFTAGLDSSGDLTTTANIAAQGNITTSGNLTVTGITSGRVLQASSGGLIVGRSLVAGTIIPVTAGPEPARVNGSMLWYNSTSGFFLPTQNVTVTATDGGLNVADAGISMTNSYLVMGAGSYATVSGPVNVSSLNVTGNANVSGNLSAATYLNIRPVVSAVDSATTTTVNIGGDYDLYLVNTTTTSVTLYLPDASAWNNKRITVSKVDDGGSYRSVTLSGATLQTATNTVLLYDPTESVTVISNGTNWYSLDYDRAYGVVVVCKNTTGSTLAKGTPVRISGATGANVLISAVSAANNHVPEAPSGQLSKCIGIVEHNIPTDEFGHVLTKGTLYKYNTDAFNEGDQLYLAASGGLTNVRPSAPYDEEFIGIVTRKSSTNGSIFVNIQNAIHLNDIAGMNIASSLINGDLIKYDLATSTFVNTQSIDISGTIKAPTVSATLDLYGKNATLTDGTLLLSNTDIQTPAAEDLTLLPGSGGDIVLSTNTKVRVPFANVAVTGNISSTGDVVASSVSATTYLNLPSSTAIWNANKLQGSSISSGTAANGDALIWNSASAAWTFSPSSGFGAPVGASYLTLGLNSRLTAERVLTPGTGLSVTDNGANGTYDIAADYTNPIWYAGNMFQKSIYTANVPQNNGDLIYYNSNDDWWDVIPSSTIAGGGGAPTDAQYLTLATNGSLSAERVLTAGAGLGSNDGGANGNFTLSANYTSAIWNASQIHGTNISSTAPTTSQRLVYNGVGWKPGWLETSTITGSGTITLNANDDVFFASADTSGIQTLILPDASAYSGKSITIIKVDTSGIPIVVSSTGLNTLLNRVKLRLPREKCDFYSDGTNWYPNTIRRDFGGCHSNSYEIFEDFVFASTETGEIGLAGWSFTNGTVANNNVAGNNLSGAFGVISRNSGTTAGQVASFHPAGGNLTTQNRENVEEFKIRMAASGTAANHHVSFGFASDFTTSAPASGIYFQRLPADTNWFAVTRSANVQNRIDTGIAYSTTMRTYRIFVKDGNNVQFFVDDALVANDINVSSTIPPASAGLLPGHCIVPTSTAAAGTTIDYIYILLEGTIERY